MADTIKASSTSKDIDRTLKAFYNAMKTEKNDGKIIYIQDGELAFATEDDLLDVIVVPDP